MLKKNKKKKLTEFEIYAFSYGPCSFPLIYGLSRMCTGHILTEKERQPASKLSGGLWG